MRISQYNYLHKKEAAASSRSHRLDRMKSGSCLFFYLQQIVRLKQRKQYAERDLNHNDKC